MSGEFGVWVAALCTLAIWSFLYKDNPFYKLAEHVFVGVSTGYLVTIALRDALYDDVVARLLAEEPNYLVLVPTVLGILMFTRLAHGAAWVSRWPIAFIVGATAGFDIPNRIQAYLLKHTEATMTPLVDPQADIWANLNAILLLVGVLCVLVYFFFSVPHEGPTKGAARIGTVYLMLFFGASFGYTIMGRISILIGRMNFLLGDWLGLGG